MSEDSANASSDDKIVIPEIYKCCDNPQITYNAPVNINVEERTIGSVDVWRCASCKKSFCEEKQTKQYDIFLPVNDRCNYVSNY